MGPLYVLGVASQVNQWLTARQSAIAENIANANTPSFKAQDVKPFDSVLDSMRLTMTATRPEHMNLNPNPYAKTELLPDETTEVLTSGNSVNLEREMIKAGEVNRSFALNTSIVKAFHRMLLSSTKG